MGANQIAKRNMTSQDISRVCKTVLIIIILLLLVWNGNRWLLYFTNWELTMIVMSQLRLYLLGPSKWVWAQRHRVLCGSQCAPSCTAAKPTIRQLSMVLGGWHEAAESHCCESASCNTLDCSDILWEKRVNGCALVTVIMAHLGTAEQWRIQATKHLAFMWLAVPTHWQTIAYDYCLWGGTVNPKKPCTGHKQEAV